MSVIFSIDYESNPMILNHFQNYLATLSLKGAVARCIGVYKGQSEHSWVMDNTDFADHIAGSHWIENQESILRIATGNKMECYLEFLADKSRVTLGSMCQVDKSEAVESGDFTFRCPDSYFPLGAYYIARFGNPDHV
jgi:hypothetical protein